MAKPPYPCPFSCCNAIPMPVLIDIQQAQPFPFFHLKKVKKNRIRIKKTISYLYDIVFSINKTVDIYLDFFVLFSLFFYFFFNIFCFFFCFINSNSNSFFYLIDFFRNKFSRSMSNICNMILNTY